MKGIAGVILAATPLAALVLYFALSGQKQIRIDQKTHEINLEIEDAKFDLEFDQITSSIQGKSLPEDVIKEKKEHIKSLKKKKDLWEDKFDAEFEQSAKELSELKVVINDHK